MFFDWVYLLFALPAMLLGLWAQARVKSAYAETQRIPVRSGLSGAETAAAILRANGISNVGIEMTQGMLSDHYDPRHKVLRLSPDVYRGRSAASVGIAAHEVGHALQDKLGYAPLALRNGIVPFAQIGSGASFLVLFAGLILQVAALVYLAVGLFATVALFQLVNLPVEFNASSRARKELVSIGIVTPDEDRVVKKVLGAAAWTYVAATVSAMMTLLYFLFRAGLLGGGGSDD